MAPPLRVSEEAAEVLALLAEMAHDGEDAVEIVNEAREALLNGQ